MFAQQVLLFTQLNGFKYCYLTLISLFNINHLFTKWGGFKSVILIILLNSTYWLAHSQMVPNWSVQKKKDQDIHTDNF